MLVVAGGVAGVLLSRGGDLSDGLEAQDVTASVATARECSDAGVTLTGDAADGVFTAGTGCGVASDSAGAGDSGDRFPAGSCRLLGGTFSGQTPGAGAGGASVCTFTL